MGVKYAAVRTHGAKNCEWVNRVVAGRGVEWKRSGGKHVSACECMWGGYGPVLAKCYEVRY